LLAPAGEPFTLLGKLLALLGDMLALGGHSLAFLSHRSELVRLLRRPLRPARAGGNVPG
jgi:hypothetical protein